METHMKNDNKDIYLVVTTEHKGVFAGYGNPKLVKNKTIRLTQARMCVYWSSDVKGVLGLAANGPTSGCKVGPPVPAITINALTSVMECSKTSAEAWEKGPWA